MRVPGFGTGVLAATNPRMARSVGLDDGQWIANLGAEHRLDDMHDLGHPDLPAASLVLLPPQAANSAVIA